MQYHRKRFEAKTDEFYKVKNHDFWLIFVFWVFYAPRRRRRRLRSSRSGGILMVGNMKTLQLWSHWLETGVRLKSSLVEIRTDILSHLTFVKPLDPFLNLSPLRLFCPSVHMEGHRTITRERGVVVRGDGRASESLLFRWRGGENCKRTEAGKDWHSAHRQRNCSISPLTWPACRSSERFCRNGDCLKLSPRL